MINVSAPLLAEIKGVSEINANLAPDAFHRDSPPWRIRPLYV